MATLNFLVLVISLYVGYGWRASLFPTSHRRKLPMASFAKRNAIAAPLMFESTMRSNVQVEPIQDAEFKINVLPAGNKGMGVFAAEAGVAGTWVCQYVGELLSYEDVRQRYPETFPEYLFEVSEDPLEWPNQPGYLDAMHSKHFSRYFNHAQIANLNFTMDPERKRIDFYLAANVQVGDELCFDYGVSYWIGADSSPEDDKRDFTTPLDHVPWISKESSDSGSEPEPFTPKNLQEFNEALSWPEKERRRVLLRSLDFFGAERLDDDLLRIPLGIGSQAEFRAVDPHKVALSVLEEAASACFSRMGKTQSKT